jgi:predicted RNase H-like nuclease (RuvC/YqgF family)
MATGKIGSVIDDLKQEEAQLKSELAELKAREKELKRELSQVRAGITALARGKTSGKRAKKAPAVAKDVEKLAELAAAVLEAEGPLPEEELAKRIGERLAATGLSAAGLRPRLKRALKGGRFLSGISGWKLIEHTFRVSQPELEELAAT